MRKPAFFFYIYKTWEQYIIICSLFVFFPASILNASKIEQLQFQIQDMDTRIRNTQSAITECGNTLQRLTQDSLAAVSSFHNSSSHSRSPLSDIEREMASSSQKIAQLKSQIQDTRRDSALLAQKLDSQRISFNRESSNLQKLISDNSLSIKNLTAQRDQHTNAASFTSNSAMEKINAENARIDLLLSKHHNELTNLGARAQKLKQDSAVLSTQLRNDQAIASVELGRQDSLLAIVNNSIQAASVRISQAKQKLTAFLTSSNQILQNHKAARAKAASSEGLVSANLTKSQNEYQRIRSGMNAEITRYENGRQPLVKKLGEVDSILHIRNMQKPLWTLMHEKVQLDSIISAKRDELDEIIQKAAKKGKNPMKFTGEKELELNDLLKKLEDQYLQKPGIKQASAKLNGLTHNQKKDRILEIRINIDKDITRQTDEKKQAAQALAAYERNNPLSSNPVMKKLQQLEESIAAMKMQRDGLNRQKDSLDGLIASQSQHINTSNSQYQREIRTLDSIMSVQTGRSVALSSQRAQLLQKQTLSRSNSQNAINKINAELKAIDNRTAVINREMADAESRKEQLSGELARSMQAHEQQKMQANAAVQNIIGQITVKEQESASYSNQLQQLTRQYNLSIPELQSTLDGFKSSIPALNNQLSAASAQYQNLQRQQGSLNSKIYASEQGLSKRMSEISAARTAYIQKQQALQVELQQLSAGRAQLVRNLKEEMARGSGGGGGQEQNCKDKETRAAAQGGEQEWKVKSVRQYDSLILLREQELMNLRAQRQKTLQNSMAKAAPPVSAASPQKAPLPPVSTAPAVSPSSSASANPQYQNIIERIYVLLGEEKKSDAFRLFTTNKEYLKATAPVEAVRILESMFE